MDRQGLPSIERLNAHAFPVVTAETVGDLDDQLVNGPYCETHGRVGATIDGKCGQCYGVGRALDDRVAKLEAENALLREAIRRYHVEPYVARSAAGWVHIVNRPFDDDTYVVDLTEGPF